MICYIIQKTWTGAVSDRDCAFSNRQFILQRGFEEAFQLSIQDLKLGKGPHGKPFVIGNPDACFNLTNTWKRPAVKSSVASTSLSCKPVSLDTRQYYMAGAFAPFPVGLDCEYPRPLSKRLSDRVLSDEEKAQLELSLHPEEMFLRFWTLKECYVKYTGEGLSRELSSISFYQDQSGCWSLKGHPGITFFQFDLADGLIVSLCCDEKCQVQFVTL